MKKVHTHFTQILCIVTAACLSIPAHGANKKKRKNIYQTMSIHAFNKSQQRQIYKNNITQWHKKYDCHDPYNLSIAAICTLCQHHKALKETYDSYGALAKKHAQEICFWEHIMHEITQQERCMHDTYKKAPSIAASFAQLLPKEKPTLKIPATKSADTYSTNLTTSAPAILSSAQKLTQAYMTTLQLPETAGKYEKLVLFLQQTQALLPSYHPLNSNVTAILSAWQSHIHTHAELIKIHKQTETKAMHEQAQQLYTLLYQQALTINTLDIGMPHVAIDVQLYKSKLLYHHYLASIMSYRAPYNDDQLNILVHAYKKLITLSTKLELPETKAKLYQHMYELQKARQIYRSEQKEHTPRIQTLQTSLLSIAELSPRTSEKRWALQELERLSPAYAI